MVPVHYPAATATVWSVVLSQRLLISYVMLKEKLFVLWKAVDYSIIRYTVSDKGDPLRENTKHMITVESYCMCILHFWAHLIWGRVDFCPSNTSYPL